MDYAKEIVVLRTCLEEIEKKLSLVRKTASVDYQTQIDALESSVNACQNTLTSIEQDLQAINGVLLSQDTAMSTNASNIESIQTALTSAQIAISTLESQVTTLRFEMNIANGNISYLTSTLNATVFALEMLQVAVATAITNITTLQGEMTTTQANITSNTNAINTLESSLAPVAFSGDYNDLTNKPSGTGGGGDDDEDEMASEVMTSSTDEFYELNEFEVADGNNEIKHENVYFVCSPEMYIEGNVDVHLYSHQYTQAFTVRLYYMEDLVFEEAVTITNYEQVLNFPFRVYPKDKKGYFAITIVYQIGAFIKNATFHITSGKNFLFLNNNLRWTVTVYKHKYYIGHNIKFPNLYYVLDANNFQFTNGNFSYVTMPTWATYFPKPTYENGALTIDENHIYSLGRTTANLRYNVYDIGVEIVWFSNMMQWAFLLHTSPTIPHSIKNTPSQVFTAHKGNLCIGVGIQVLFMALTLFHII